MFVKYTGKCDHIIEEFNGKRYSWHKGDTLDIPQEVFVQLQSSGNIRKLDFVPVSEPQKKIEPEIEPEITPKIQSKVRRKKGRR